MIKQNFKVLDLNLDPHFNHNSNSSLQLDLNILPCKEEYEGNNDHHELNPDFNHGSSSTIRLNLYFPPCLEEDEENDQQELNQERLMNLVTIFLLFLFIYFARHVHLFTN